MTQARMQKLAAAIREVKMDHVLLTSLSSLRYFAGYTAGIETGPSPFSPILGALLWIAGEPPRLFLADMESSEGLAPGLEITPFESYTAEKPLAAAKDVAAKLLARLEALPASRVGMETEEVPAAVFEPLRSRCPRIEFQDISSALAKIVKDEEEISPLREALDLCDLGQTLVKSLAQRGMTLAEGINKVRPGVRACDLDASLRKRVLRLNGGYPHHSGHGLGVTWHEEPRIVLYNPVPLEPGM